MRVKALRKGFDNYKTREVDEVFEWEGKVCPSWCKELDKKPAAKKPAEIPVED